MLEEDDRRNTPTQGVAVQSHRSGRYYFEAQLPALADEERPGGLRG